MAQTLSDSELVARCRSGDQQAWAELVDRFSRYVYAISVQAFRLSDADAEDVFQEVFARAYEHLDGLRDDAAVRPWLAQLTRRLCIDRLRATSRERPTTDEDLELAGSEETLTMLEDALTVHEALAATPEHCREILDRFLPATRATAPSPRRSTSRPERSRAASPGAWGGYVSSSREELSPIPRLVPDDRF